MREKRVDVCATGDLFKLHYGAGINQLDKRFDGPRLQQQSSKTFSIFNYTIAQLYHYHHHHHQQQQQEKQRSRPNQIKTKVVMSFSSCSRFLVSCCVLVLSLLVVSVVLVQGFSSSSDCHTPTKLVKFTQTFLHHTCTNHPCFARIAPLQQLNLHRKNDIVEEDADNTNALLQKHTFQQKTLASVALVMALVLTSPVNNNPAFAYNNDYASDTVQKAVQSLQDAAGNADKTFDAFENIAEIIAEGKGVGGTVDYKGVTLDRGYIADEDTSIYNPGLTLLTEGEKQRLVISLIQSRQAGIATNQWNDKNQGAYSFLKFQLDPLHMTELRGYLQVAPVLVGIFYLGVLAVQQLARNLFPIAYLGAVLLLLAPAVVLVLTAQ